MKKIDHSNVGYILNQLIEIRYTLNDLEIEKLSTAEAIRKIREYTENITEFVMGE